MLRKILPAGLVALAVGCASGHPVPGVTVTKTVTRNVPGPVVTRAVPGPTVTVTVTKTAQPPVLMTKTFGGSGQWNSPVFALGCGSPAVQASYSYSGNTLGGMASNFIADLKAQDGGDDQSIANTIAASGGAVTTLYPDTSSGSTRYYLAVQADGSWTFTLKETC